MTMRRPILAANWKMQKTTGEAEAFVERFLPLVDGADDVDIVLAPTFTALDRVRRAIAGSNILLAAQNVNPEPKGAFTGEISTAMLADLGCAYGIVGHSARFFSLYDLIARGNSGPRGGLRMLVHAQWIVLVRQSNMGSVTLDDSFEHGPRHRTERTLKVGPLDNLYRRCFWPDARG